MTLSFLQIKVKLALFSLRDGTLDKLFPQAIVPNMYCTYAEFQISVPRFSNFCLCIFNIAFLECSIYFDDCQRNFVEME